MAQRSRKGRARTDDRSSLPPEKTPVARPAVVLLADPRGVAETKAREAAKCAADGQPDRALKYYLLAAEYGHAGACFECGVRYEHGVPRLLEPDLRQAVLRYMMAAIGGFAAARYNLAFMYEKGLGGLKPSVDRSLQLFDAAAELGHDRAATALADRLFQGVVHDKAGGGPGAGAPEDFTDEAIFYWVLAARMGNSQACIALSYVFAEGISVGCDFELSDSFWELGLLLWWRKLKSSTQKSSEANSGVSMAALDTVGRVAMDTIVDEGQGKKGAGGARKKKEPGGASGGGGGGRAGNGASASGASGSGGAGSGAAGAGSAASPDTAQQSRRTDRVLRLPGFFNKAGASALMKERELQKRWQAGPREVKELLEKHQKNLRAAEYAKATGPPSPATPQPFFPPNTPANAAAAGTVFGGAPAATDDTAAAAGGGGVPSGDASLSLSLDDSSAASQPQKSALAMAPVPTLLEFISTLEEYDKKKSRERVKDHEEDGEDVDWEKNKSRNVAPCVHPFTFRNPQTVALVVKDFKRLGGLLPGMGDKQAPAAKQLMLAGQAGNKKGPNSEATGAASFPNLEAMHSSKSANNAAARNR